MPKTYDDQTEQALACDIVIDPFLGSAFAMMEPKTPSLFLEKVSRPQQESPEFIRVFNDINPQQHQTYKWTAEKDKFAHWTSPYECSRR